MGRVVQAKTAVKSRKIVIYICAADSQVISRKTLPRTIKSCKCLYLETFYLPKHNCCVEKGALHNIIYPELRAHCRSRGYELHIVDLHWKTLLEKQQDHEFPELCIGELTSLNIFLEDPRLFIKINIRELISFYPLSFIPQSVNRKSQLKGLGNKAICHIFIKTTLRHLYILRISGIYQIKLVVVYQGMAPYLKHDSVKDKDYVESECDSDSSMDTSNELSKIYVWLIPLFSKNIIPTISGFEQYRVADMYGNGRLFPKEVID
ncbi:hypothetical protein NQ317_004477 [Molorchus minor]|uniref:Uncharacterized protein n=1 Tax=Molorchus minor TaxID=1323400 RepID=A0ABQ9IR77_9CUCU|nr:hypothetical protein NQ317_004477 [Molorchus minor]